MKKIFITLLLLPALCFGQGRLLKFHDCKATVFIFKTGTLASLLSASGGSYPITCKAQDNSGNTEIVIISANKVDTANVTRGANPINLGENSNIDIYDSPIYKSGISIATSQIQTTTQPLPPAAFPALTGDVMTNAGNMTTTINSLAVTGAKIANNTIDLTTKVTGVLPVANGGTMTGITAMSGTINTITVPMTSAIYTVTPTGAMTWNATAGTYIGQRVTFDIITSGVTSFNLTPGTNFKSAVLATGTTTAKEFTIDFIWKGAVWKETARTAGQ